MGYSLGAGVLARVVEVVSGQSFDQFLQTRLFKPLGMVDTGFFVPPSASEFQLPAGEHTRLGLAPGRVVLNPGPWQIEGTRVN